MINQTERMFVYALVDPRIMKIKYVGCSKNIKQRYFKHMKPSSINQDTRKNEWLRELKSLQLKPAVTILEITSVGCWQNREKYWIEKIGRENLTNATSGGIGFSGRDEKTQEKYSRSRKGITTSWKGKHYSEETRVKMKELKTKRKIEKDLKKEFLPKKSKEEIINDMMITKQGAKVNNHSTSRYIGVSYNKRANKYTASINFQGKSYYLGRYSEELDAALAYNRKALELYGSNAKINIF